MLYERTLHSYREFFGAEPPRDIWPPNEIRFREAPHFRRINTRRVWIVKKPAWATFRRPQVGLPARDWLRLAPLLFVGMLAGCAELQSEGPNGFNWHGQAFLLFFWSLSAIGLTYGLWRKNAELRPLDAVFPSQPLDAFHIARLRDAKNGAVDVALAVLHQKGALEITPDQTLRATGKNLALSPFENAVLARLGFGGETARAVRQLLKAETGRLDQNLRELGLLVSRETEKTADNWPLGLTFGLLIIGAIKTAVGLSRERPVGFLVMSCAVLVGFLAYFMTHPARLSRRGALYLASLRTRQPNAHAIAGEDFDALGLHFALFGPATYPAEIQRVLRPPSGGESGGNGCSAASDGGDGGGCGGGGCGGCGGCGG